MPQKSHYRLSLYLFLVRTTFRGRNFGDETDKFLDRPYVIRQPRLHCRGDPQRLMDPAEVVVRYGFALGWREFFGSRLAALLAAQFPQRNPRRILPLVGIEQRCTVYVLTDGLLKPTRNAFTAKSCSLLERLGMTTVSYFCLTRPSGEFSD